MVGTLHTTGPGQTEVGVNLENNNFLHHISGYCVSPDKKARLKIAKFHTKLKDTRNYFLNKLSTEMSAKSKQLFERLDKNV